MSIINTPLGIFLLVTTLIMVILNNHSSMHRVFGLKWKTDAKPNMVVLLFQYILLNFHNLIF